MIRGILTLLALATGVWLVLAAHGDAQSNPFRQLAGRPGEPPAASLWLERADGRGRLVFDRSGRISLVWEEGSQEVLAVFRARAAGGGEVWLTDTDRTLLRMTNLGGWTYFPPDSRDGVIVDPIGPAQALVAAPADGEALEAAARDMVDTLARLSRREVGAELTSLTPDQNPYIIDAMRMIEVGAQSASRRGLRDLEIIRVGVGESPRASFDGRTLDVSVATHLGYGGRPSSDYLRRLIDQQG